MYRLLPQRVRRFFGDHNGSATVESVLWLPIFFALFGLMTDTAMIFNGYSRVLRVVQDANRNMSVGRIDNEIELQEYVSNALSDLAPNSSVQSDVSSGVVTTKVLVPASDLEILGMFGALNKLSFEVQSQQFIEF
jgi:Flp pilus assembly protein TadG